MEKNIKIDPNKHSERTIQYNLKQIQSMLNIEKDYWYKKNNKNKICSKIQTYDETIDLLIRFVEDQNLIGFLSVFIGNKITIDSIRTCFLDQGRNDGVAERRNYVHQLFG